MELLRSRRSVRVFSDKPVQREELLDILEAARMAPLHIICRDVHYVVYRTGDTGRHYQNRGAVFLAIAKQLRNPLIAQTLPAGIDKNRTQRHCSMLPTSTY